jgi:glycosyltransferase involved in cell wall biosynthesis
VLPDAHRGHLASTPRVSVVIPAYNAAPFIADTLGSVVAQTFTEYEVIVVNDGSPDTPEFERALGPYLDRIRYLKQQNTGPSGARNLAIRHARGEFVAFLDSDDQWLPDFLEAQVRMLDMEPSIDLLYSDGVIVGEPPLAGRNLMSVSPSRGPITFERLVREECTVLTTCAIARRDAVVAAGLFDERFRRAEDFHLWLKMALDGANIRANPAVLVRHRRRPGSLAHDTKAMLCAFVAVLEDIDANRTLTSEQRETIARAKLTRGAELALLEGKAFFVDGEYRLALAKFDRACALEPSPARQLRLRAIRAGIAVAPRVLHRLYAAYAQVL